MRDERARVGRTRGATAALALVVAGGTTALTVLSTSALRTGDGIEPVSLFARSADPAPVFVPASDDGPATGYLVAFHRAPAPTSSPDAPPTAGEPTGDEQAAAGPAPSSAAFVLADADTASPGDTAPGDSTSGDVTLGEPMPEADTLDDTTRPGRARATEPPGLEQASYVGRHRSYAPYRGRHRTPEPVESVAAA